jgi:hypothetical protein
LDLGEQILVALGEDACATQWSGGSARMRLHLPLAGNFPCQSRLLPVKSKYPHCPISMRVFVCFNQLFAVDIQALFVPCQQFVGD